MFPSQQPYPPQGYAMPPYGYAQPLSQPYAAQPAPGQPGITMNFFQQAPSNCPLPLNMQGPPQFPLPLLPTSILDGIGLVVLILITVAFCSYCYRCCCVQPPTGTEARPRRNRRQKNARRKRRRRQQSRTPNANRPPNPPCTVNIFPDQLPQSVTVHPPYPSQCTVNVYSDEQPQPGMVHPPYPNGQPPYYPHSYYPQYPMNSSSDHGQLLPPPYESLQRPQRPSQSFGASMEPDLSCFSQVPPPPPYDTCPQPVPTSCHESGGSNRKC
ncbi:hypothetical protein JTE90_009649 [Oedothorax gibbosus]|uniref:Uncharacterized protein n=1 Tax=Oedothorax gibbosus TaxID=931172 RepID=A0AAV6VAF3_9ARAC|nr:hypothetical protein JTE90_009649 [Oedothorax gibbosus]